jgi:hypothetical protein
VAEVAPRRFVLLRHTGHGPVHFDLMIAHGTALATWQFADSPTLLAPGATLPCRQLAEHRMAYLDYEGPVGGERGQVQRAAAGTCTLHSATATDWDFDLDGPTLHGKFRLRCGPNAAWSLTKLATT